MWREIGGEMVRSLVRVEQWWRASEREGEDATMLDGDCCVAVILEARGMAVSVCLVGV
jgi:hypothetical protein